MDEKDGNVKEMQDIETDFECPFNGLEYGCEACHFEHPDIFGKCQDVNGFDSEKDCEYYPDKCRTCDKYGICADTWGWE